MSVLHYFFGNDKKRAEFIFNFIAPVYGKIDRVLENGYMELAEALNKKYPLKGLSILDIGTGTGSWLAALSKYSEGGRLCGVDMSEKMLKQAKAQHPGLEFIHQDAEDLKIFDDNSFNVVTASFVLHGMKAPERKKIIKEMKRIASDYVFIQDYYIKPEKIVRFVEAMERSDYKNFMRMFKGCMEDNFDDVELITIDKRTIYAGKVRMEKDKV